VFGLGITSLKTQQRPLRSQQLLCVMGFFMMNDWFENKIFCKPQTKEIRESIPKVVQNSPFLAMNDVD
jgi:hypothetical protein